MKKIKLLFMYCMLFLFIGYLFFNKDLELIINDSLDIFFRRVFPSLFPMFIISDLLISFNFVYYINKYTTRFFYKIFKLNGSCTYIFIMSLISGTPVNALVTSELYNNNFLSKEDATRIMSFTLFLNPLFLFVMLSLVFDLKTTIFLIINNYICSIILGLLLREDGNLSSSKIEFNNISIANALINSISKSISVLTMILGTIVFFNLFRFGIDNSIINSVISGTLEITGGLNSLNTDINYFVSVLLASFMISFCGLCIHMQIKSIIADTINYKVFIKNRLIHLFLSWLGCWFFCLTFT